MNCYVCELLDDHLVLLEHLDGKWIDYREDNDIIWVPADIEVIEEIRNRGV